MEVSLKEIDLTSRHILENLFPLYIYDMSEYMGWSPNQEGLFIYNNSNFDVYWDREDHTPYFICVDGDIAGFVLIRKYPTNLSLYDIEQFFILRKYKRKGVGKGAIAQVLNHYPGEWQIRVLLENSGALAFWEAAIANAVGRNYTLEKDIDVDKEMHFIRFNVLNR